MGGGRGEGRRHGVGWKEAWNKSVSLWVDYGRGTVSPRYWAVVSVWL